MTQNADNVLDHFELFRGPEYKEMFKNKREQFEAGTPDAEVQRVTEWTKTAEYQEKNFAREALTVNPAKACQPLGAVFAAVGFERHAALRSWQPGLRRLLSQPLLASLQGADILRLLVHDGRCGGVRRPQQHDRRPCQQL